MQAEKLVQRINQHLITCRPKNVSNASSLVYSFFRNLVSSSEGLVYFTDYPYLKKLQAVISCNKSHDNHFFVTNITLYYVGERLAFERRVKVENEQLRNLDYDRIFRETLLDNRIKDDSVIPNLGINFREIEQIKF